MVIDVGSVLSAYSKTGGIIDSAGDSASPVSTGGAGSFADALKSYAGDTVSSLQAGEKAATSAVSGKTDLASVVTAIDNAEVVLDEVVAIRDKVIAAYQSISSGAI